MKKLFAPVVLCLASQVALAAQKAQGFIICAPDVKLCAAVECAAKRNGREVISVDDQLVDGAGKSIASTPHMGISALDQLPTACERTQGAVDALKAAGFPGAQIVDAAQGKTDTEIDTDIDTDTESALNVYSWIATIKAPGAVTLTNGSLMTCRNQADIRATMGL